MRKFLVLLVILTLLGMYLVGRPAQAAISSCTANVQPNSVDRGGSPGDFQFTLTNSDSTNITRWIKVIRPSGDFTLVSTTVSGWSNSTNGSDATLTGGTLSPGGTLNFTVRSQWANAIAPPQNWTVQASDSAGGASPTSCTGNLSTGITGTPDDTTPPMISDITLSSLTTNSVTISWITDEPATSQVFYGPTIDYGSSSALDSTLKTSHKVSLSDLAPNSGYHYYVASQDARGNLAQSADNTFLTPIPSSSTPSPPSPPPSPSAGTSPAPSTTPSPSTVPIQTTPTETTPPVISLATVLTNPYKETPTISGGASDNEAVARIEYSTDGGSNWSLVTNVKGIGGKKVTFDFLPPNLEDGNYRVVARATDTSGNRGTSNTLDLVIDRLPPLVGGNVVSIGPQILYPDEQGAMTTIAGVDQKITLAAVGGPTAITLSASLPKNNEQLFTLTQSPETGLWSGILSFQHPGSYEVRAHSIDGAGNVKDRPLNTIQVLPPGLLQLDGKPISEATVTVYYLEPVAQTWTLWDGASYGEMNPQTTKEAGQFRFVLPPGQYYLKVERAGLQTVVSEIITLTETQPISTTIAMTEQPGFSLGPLNLRLPWFAKSIELDLKKPANPDDLAHSLIDKPTPNFTLPATDGLSLAAIDLRGRPTVLTFLTSWSPSFAEQVPVLEGLQREEDLNIYPVLPLENLARIAVLAAASGYDVTFLVDPDGTTVESYSVTSLPMHFFVSRKGVVKEVIQGVLSREAIEAHLTGL